MKNGLPKSNNGPCQCSPQKGDSLQGIPDHVQRPARKEVSVKAIGPNMKLSNGGYKVVEVRSGGEPVGMGEGRKMRKREMDYEDDED
jgi:hypothetical protein